MNNLVEFKFNNKHSSREDVERFIYNSYEFKEVSTRMLALGIDEPIEFTVERTNYLFDIICEHVTDTASIIQTKYSSEYIFKIRLVVDIKLFDTPQKVYLPGKLDEIEVIGNTNDVKFENSLIGGLFVSDIQTVIVEKFAFNGLRVKETPLYIYLTDKDGCQLQVSDLYKNCEIEKIRTLYNIESYNDFIKNGNKILKINRLDISSFFNSIYDKGIENMVLNSQEVQLYKISIVGVPGTICDFDIDNYILKMNEIITKVLNLNLSANIDVCFVPGILYKYKYNNELNKIKNFIYYLSNISNERRRFSLYASLN